MKNWIKAYLMAAVACAAAGCGMDSAQLGECVKKEMQEELVKTTGLKDLKMKEVRLVRGEGIEYSGVGKGEIGGHVVKFDVTCKYDGKTVLWDAKPSEENLALLATKEKARDICNALKAAWPEVKKSAKETLDAASKKAGEYYDAAKKKTGEYYDAAKKKTGEYYDAAKKKTGEYYDAAKKKTVESLSR